MRDTKVYLVLENLSNRERGKLARYLESPYFNKNQPLLRLFRILNRDINSARSKPLSKTAVWKKMQCEQPYDDVRFRKYLSDLLKNVENFLALQIFEENNYQKNNFLLEAILDHKMEKLYTTIKKTTHSLTKKSPLKNPDYYLFRYKSQKLLHDLETDNEQKKKISTNFSELSRTLDIFYFSEKLKLHYDAEVWKRIDGNLDADVDFIEEITRFIRQQGELEAPALAVYFSMHLLNKYPDQDKYYFAFKKQLDDKIQFFPSHEAIPIYTAGINHCIRKINTGDSSFLEELFSLYRGYVKSLVEDSGQLSQWTFNNAITVGLRLGQFAWVKQCISEYGPYITEKHRENAVTYNTASYHFYQEEYDEVIAMLRNIEYEDIYYNLNSKTILLMTYYETDEFDPLYFLLESFRAYLNRNKTIPESKKINYKNFIKLTRRLANLPPGNPKALEKLKKEINETKQVSSRKWLLDKVAELE